MRCVHADDRSQSLFRSSSGVADALARVRPRPQLPYRVGHRGDPSRQPRGELALAWGDASGGARAMRDNVVKQRLQRGETSLGTMVFEFATTGIARLAAGGGADFVIYDMEHTGWSGDTTRMLLATSRAADIVPIVRVATNRYELVATQLDLGAMGVMVPMVETRPEAEAIVSSARYPPVGRRGAAFGIAHDDYIGGRLEEKIGSANEAVLTIAQIETPVGVENVDEIAAVDGLDMLWLGQFDLTNFLGIPGRFDDPRFVDAVRRVRDAAHANHKSLGILVNTPEEAARWIAQGFRCIAFGGDLWLYRDALAAGIATIRGQTSDTRP